MFRDKTPLFRIAMIALVLSSLLGFAARRYPAFHPDLVDGVHGLLLGVAIAGMCVTLWRGQSPTSRDFR